MPSDVKAILSAIALAVAVGFAYWERSVGNGHLFWFVVSFGVFAVVAMWVFPEAVGKKDAKNGRIVPRTPACAPSAGYSPLGPF